MAETVLVTGGTGFVAQHCILQLLAAGYRVTTTVRSPGSASRLLDRLAAHGDSRDIGDPASRLRVVTADLTEDDGWASAVRGCRFVLHVASPVPLAMPRNEDDLVVPARDGTLRVLRAARAGGVERVVLTSSLAAVGAGRPRDHVFTEADWSDPTSRRCDAYARSKTLAERAAWDEVGAQGPGTALTLATICPGIVLGPVLAREWSASGEAVKRMLEGRIPGIPDLVYSPVDVRDVAGAHLAAMTSPRAAGQRYICGLEAVPLREVALILASHYRRLGYRVPTRRLPTGLLRVAAWFDRDLRLAVHEAGQPFSIDPGKIRRELGVTFRSLEEMTLAMAESMIRYGVVKDRRGARVRGDTDA
jgi:nucleoside-diphosphate-sugar epimerase